MSQPSEFAASGPLHGAGRAAERIAPAFYLVCFSGPDLGKRVALMEGYVRIGSAADCEILSDDPEVTPGHAILALEAGRVSVQPVDGAMVVVDGHRVVDAVAVVPGQQLRMGRSMWRIEDAHAAGLGSLLKGLGERISSAAGVEKIQGFSAGEMFSEVFKKRQTEEIEAYFISGTEHTTPALSTVDTNWPKPWAFARIFLFSVVAFFLLQYGLREFQNPNFIPGVMLVGSVAFPCAILVFFYEMNVVRNVSLPALLKFMVFGGILSLLSSLFLFRFTTGLSDWLGAMSAGLVEETGKMLVLLLFVRERRYRWTLNGLLIGAAVGTGFSVFETMGYVMNKGLFANGITGMLAIITERGWLNVLGDHALWTGLVGAALWRVRGDRSFEFGMLADSRFLRVLGLAMVLHMINNAPFYPPYYLKFWAIGFVAWVALISFIQTGLHEVRGAQQEAPASAA